MTALRVALLLSSLWAAAAWAGGTQRVYVLGVDGLACPFCAYGIEKKLGAIEGVQSLDVDIRKGAVIVHMAADAILDQAAAERAVTDAGFDLRSFDQVPAD